MDLRTARLRPSYSGLVRRHGVDWGGHALLPEGVPEIDTDPLSLGGRCGGGRE